MTNPHTPEEQTERDALIEEITSRTFPHQGTNETLARFGYMKTETPQLVLAEGVEQPEEKYSDKLIWNLDRLMVVQTSQLRRLRAAAVRKYLLMSDIRE